MTDKCLLLNGHNNELLYVNSKTKIFYTQSQFLLYHTVACQKQHRHLKSVWASSLY